MTEIQRTELDINTASRMPIQDFINRVLWATSRETAEDQAIAIIKALNNYGYVILQNPISEKMEAAGKQATGMGMFGYSMQDAIDAMIEAQEVS